MYVSHKIQYIEGIDRYMYLEKQKPELGLESFALQWLSHGNFAKIPTFITGHSIIVSCLEYMFNHYAMVSS